MVWSYRGESTLAIDVAWSIRSARVIDVLAKLISVRGAPRYLRRDNWPEFVGTALLSLMVEQEIELALIDSGKLGQNGTNESFDGKFQDECLAMEWFRNLLEARVVIKDWQRHYKQTRPHPSQGDETLEAFSRKVSIDLLTVAIPA